MVLLDSEGIDAVTSAGSDDHCIFTLIILLASVFIYNSAGVPTRTDLNGLQYLLSPYMLFPILIVSYCTMTKSISNYIKTSAFLFFLTRPLFCFYVKDFTD